MRLSTFKRLVAELTPKEKRELREFLMDDLCKHSVMTECSFCHSDDLVMFGRKRWEKLNYYHCRNCNENFSINGRV